MSEVHGNLHCFRVKVRFVVVSSFVLGVRREMPRRGWSTAPDGWVQIIRGPRPLSECWPKVGRNSADFHPKSNEVRSFEGRWRCPQQFRASLPPEVVVGGSQGTCRWDRGRIGALAASGYDRWPRGSGVEGLHLESEVICTRATSHRPDQPDGVVLRKGKEEADSNMMQHVRHL